MKDKVQNFQSAAQSLLLLPLSAACHMVCRPGGSGSGFLGVRSEAGPFKNSSPSLLLHLRVVVVHFGSSRALGGKKPHRFDETWTIGETLPQGGAVDQSQYFILFSFESSGRQVVIQSADVSG